MSAVCLCRPRIFESNAFFSSKLTAGSSLAYSGQRRHFVKPRTKIKDPLASAPQQTLSYPNLTETSGIPDNNEKTTKLTFIHRPPPTAPSPHSLTSAPASPLLRPPTSHEKLYKGVVKLVPGKAAVITSNPLPIMKNTKATSGDESDEPPLLKPYPHNRTRHLTENELAKMRQLRLKNPTLFSRSRLAKMFNCSPIFVGMVAPLERDKLKQVWREQEEQKMGWTWRKQLVREARVKRRALW